MAADRKLATTVHTLRDAGIDVLVMGGHAVRYYGIDRNTADFDLVTSLATPQLLRERLMALAPGLTLREEPVWRADDFARYEIGRLPDGREEWLEFWLRNHLLDNFADLKSRSEIGDYGGEQLPFLSLPDLIRSKQTERESDWQDIALLEEIQDARHHAAVEKSSGALIRLLSNLRSRRGMDLAIGRNLLQDPPLLKEAARQATHPVSWTFLAPSFFPAERPPLCAGVDSQILPMITGCEFASPKHFAIIEITRRLYKRRAMDIDRADKQKRLPTKEHQ